MFERLDISIYGQVQGVGFRWAARQRAGELGVSGLIRNENGRVYIEAEGESGSLETFLEWCYAGPEGARVERVEASEGPLKHFSGFEIAD